MSTTEAPATIGLAEPPGGRGVFPDKPAPGFASVKIQQPHRDRVAVVYIRQSSPQQVRVNRESTARQYALVNFAVSLGWSSERVLVIDDDQGHSAAQRGEDRSGF